MLIIFDCDGVLVDSETLAAQVFSQTLRRIGITMTPDACHQQFKGKTLQWCYHWLENHYALRLPQNFHQQLSHATEQSFQQQLRPVPGIDQVLHFLRTHDVPYCVASNGSHQKIQSSLNIVGLNDAFPYRFSVDDVAKGKPCPDLFLYAARQMGVRPAHCMVIEDSLSGAQAALAAGMPLWFFNPEANSDWQAQLMAQTHTPLPASTWSFSHMHALWEKLQGHRTNRS